MRGLRIREVNGLDANEWARDVAEVLREIGDQLAAGAPHDEGDVATAVVALHHIAGTLESAGRWPVASDASPRVGRH